jgi:hypothetical protein
MKKRLLLMVPLLLILYSSLLTWARDPVAPKIFIQDKVYDAGEVDEGTLIEHTFKVVNQGNELLEVKKVKSNS